MRNIYLLFAYLAIGAISYVIAVGSAGSAGVALAQVSGTGCNSPCCDTPNGDCCVYSQNSGVSCNCIFVDPFFCYDEYGWGAGFCQGTC